jgi:hypothetical protein
VGACLSLTGRYARFGTQAARGLEAWRKLDGKATLVIEDDQSSPHHLERVLPRVAGRCDVLLGPYSTQLMRTAGKVAAGTDLLLWNHGGSGDDVEGAHPGHIISVPTPASRYAEPFVTRMAADEERPRLWITPGSGAFGRQVAAGAEAAAIRAGIGASRTGTGELPSPEGRWGLLCAGTFEDDIETLRRARSLPCPPEVMCSVAAGVREFGDAITDPEGIFGMGQWYAGGTGDPDLGPSEASFLAAWSAVHPGVPDYPAVQAAASAVLAVHCARASGSTRREILWDVATGISARTLFGDFRISRDGVQAGHQSVLVRWTERGLELAF